MGGRDSAVTNGRLVRAFNWLQGRGIDTRQRMHAWVKSAFFESRLTVADQLYSHKAIIADGLKRCAAVTYRSN